jgi:hypothetical protein
MNPAHPVRLLQLADELLALAARCPSQERLPYLQTASGALTLAARRGVPPEKLRPARVWLLALTVRTAREEKAA